ncbi:facilitated trehalose transporter Tret1-like [Belonocnema kinseyi]|uniref:facilitated trehalose transporter Tret1-like n=1 Tax=Belonocnema kinseyi TaxID=2817044 RepID=UPI00143D035C|nr:facilitated trehalose transporter Tret1-like [Belonocnema kinseyi]
MCAATSYLADVGDKNTRGIFLVIVKLSLNIGVFIVMLLGACVTYNQMNLILLLLPLIFIFIFPFMPDSTNLKKGGESSLFSAKKEKERKEEETLLKNEENQETLGMKIVEEPITNIGIRLRNLFTRKNNQRAFIIISLIFITEALSGHAAVMAFTEEILDCSEYSLSAEYASLVVAAMKIIASLLSTQIIERIDRKILFLSSGILAIISQAIVGIFFWVKFHIKMDVSSMNWIPLFAITVYEMVGNTGIGSMGLVYSGELFSPDVKGIGITLTNISFELAAFFVKLQFRAVVSNYGIASAFFSFAISCAVGTVTVFYLAPETKNKSLKEIQKIMVSESTVCLKAEKV